MVCGVARARRGVGGDAVGSVEEEGGLGRGRCRWRGRGKRNGVVSLPPV